MDKIYTVKFSWDETNIESPKTPSVASKDETNIESPKKKHKAAPMFDISSMPMINITPSLPPPPMQIMNQINQQNAQNIIPPLPFIPMNNANPVTIHLNDMLPKLNDWIDWNCTIFVITPMNSAFFVSMMKSN